MVTPSERLAAAESPDAEGVSCSTPPETSALLQTESQTRFYLAKHPKVIGTFNPFLGGRERGYRSPPPQVFRVPLPNG